MSYCKVGDKAKVTYQFQDGQPTIYQSSVSPVDVMTGKANPDGTGSNYNPQGFGIAFNSPQGQFGQIQITVLDYELYTYNGGNYIRSIPCGGTSYPKNPDGSIVSDAYGGAVITSPVVVDNTVHCPGTPTDDGKCQIVISNNGQTLFQARGDCPINFTVACGDGCPKGQCKCHSDSYPGYCCLDCKTVAAKIGEVVNDLKYRNLRNIPPPSLT